MKQLIRLRADVTVEIDTETPDNLPETMTNASLSIALVEGLIQNGILPDPTRIVRGHRHIELVVPKLRAVR